MVFKRDLAQIVKHLYGLEFKACFACKRKGYYLKCFFFFCRRDAVRNEREERRLQRKAEIQRRKEEKKLEREQNRLLKERNKYA